MMGRGGGGHHVLGEFSDLLLDLGFAFLHRSGVGCAGVFPLPRRVRLHLCG